MSSEIELKPCPFCGGNELFRTADNINATDRINCKACKANNVLWKWNTRAPRIISVEELEKAEIAVHSFHTRNGWQSSTEEWKASCRALAGVTLATLGITVGES